MRKKGLKMWIFGYGSLLWKVDFDYEKKIVGYIKGYHRRFYQHSIDHRGTPEKPGRVVTLVNSTDANCVVWGMAYKISPENIENVIKQLDYREKNGYNQKSIIFYPQDINFKPIELTLYIATEDNQSYAGPAPIEAIAKQVVSCYGPSGSNKEYVYKLAKAMRTLTPDVKDDHLFELEAAVKALDKI